MDQRRIKRGSTWINVDQASSACSFSLQLVAAVLTHGSCVMAHGSCVMRPTLQASCVPRFRRQASGSWLMRHASGSCVMRPASDSWLIRPASGSWLMRPTHVACVRLMAHASGVRRQTPRPSFSTIQPPPVAGHDDNKAAAFPSCYPLQICAH